LGLRLHPEQHGGLVTSPSGSFLDQSRVSSHASFVSKCLFANPYLTHCSSCYCSSTISNSNSCSNIYSN
jgi:hypothetical protein